MNSGGGGSSGFSPTPNFDNLLIQSLLRIRPNPTRSTAVNSLEELLLSDLLLTESGSDSEEGDSIDSKSYLEKEESKLEKQIIQTIRTGDFEKLNPNSGQAVSFGEHNVCVGFHEDFKSGYRVWEWHGHILLCDEENGYSPEYIYGNYFEKLSANMNMGSANANGDANDGEKSLNLGLKELIDGKDSSSGRIIHRFLNLKPGST